MSEQEEPNEPDLASMRLPSPEELARERAAAKAVAENPSFVAAVRKLARNTLRTSPRGLDPVYTRKTHPGLVDAPVRPGAVIANAAPEVSGSAAAMPDGYAADASVAEATKATTVDPESAASEKITPADRRVLLLGFGLMAFALVILCVGITMIYFAMKNPSAGDLQPSAQSLAHSASSHVGVDSSAMPAVSVTSVQPTATTSTATPASAEPTTTGSSVKPTATSHATTTAGTTASAQPKPSGTGLTEWTLPEKKR